MSHPRHQPRGAASDRAAGGVKLRLRLPTDGSVDLDQLRATLEAHLARSAVPGVEPEPVVEPPPEIVEPVVVQPELVAEPETTHGWKFATTILFAGIALAVVVSGTGVGLVAYGHTAMGLILGAVGLLLLGVGIALLVREKRKAAAEIQLEPEIFEETEPSLVWSWVKTNPKKTAGLGVATMAVFGVLVIAVVQGLTPGKPAEITQKNPPPAWAPPGVVDAVADPMAASLKALAQSGDVDAQFEWGARLAARAQASGLGSRVPIMANMFEQSGANGHPVAMYNAGVANVLGDGVPMNVDRAEQWFQNAAGRFPQVVSEIPAVYEARAKVLIAQADTKVQPVAKPEPVLVAAEPEEAASSQPEEGLWSRLGMVAVGLLVVVGLLATGYGKGKGADLKNQIHFWPGFRHFIAAQGAHVLMAGTIGMVCTMWLLPSTVLDSWAMDNLKPYSEVSRPDWIFYGCFLGVLVGLPLSTLVVLAAGWVGVDLMPTFDRKKIAPGGKPAWRFIKRKLHLICTMAVFVGSALPLYGLLLNDLALAWLKYSLVLGLPGAFLFKGGKLAAKVENAPPLPSGGKTGIDFRAFLRANIPLLGMLALGAAIVLVAVTGLGMDQLWWLAASAFLVVSGVAWVGFVYPRLIRHWLQITIVSAAVAWFCSWLGASFWWILGGMAVMVLAVVISGKYTLYGNSGRMLVFPEMACPARPLVHISDAGETQFNFGGLGTVAAAGLAMLISAGYFIWGDPKNPAGNLELAQQPKGKTTAPLTPKPTKPAPGEKVIPEIARQMQAKAQDWKNRAAAAPPLPAILEKLSAGYFVPKKAALMTPNQRQVAAGGSVLKAQLEAITGETATTIRTDLHPSGRWLVETKKNGQLLVWDLAPPIAAGVPGSIEIGSVMLAQITFVNADANFVNRRPELPRFNRDGSTFLIPSGDKRFARLKFVNGKLHPLKEVVLNYPPQWFSPSHQFVARIVRSNGVHAEVRDLAGAVPPTLIQTPGQTTLNFAFSPDESLAAVVTSDGAKGRVTLWNWREKRALRTFTSNAAGYLAVHFSPDGQRLFAITEVREIIAWKIAEPSQPLYRVPLGTKSAVQLRTDPTGKWLLAHWSTNPSGVGDPQKWQVINAQNGAVAFAEFQPSAPLSFSTTGKWIASKGASGFPSVHDLEQKKPVSLPALKAKVDQFHFARGNTLLVIRTIDGRAHLLNFE